jgi:hypothetical protein
VYRAKKSVSADFRVGGWNGQRKCPGHPLPLLQEFEKTSGRVRTRLGADGARVGVVQGASGQGAVLAAPGRAGVMETLPRALVNFESVLERNGIESRGHFNAQLV